MKSILLFCLISLFSFANIHAQIVCPVKFPAGADVKVYVTHDSTTADLLVSVTHDTSTGRC